MNEHKSTITFRQCRNIPEGKQLWCSQSQSLLERDIQLQTRLPYQWSRNTEKITEIKRLFCISVPLINDTPETNPAA